MQSVWFPARWHAPTGAKRLSAKYKAPIAAAIAHSSTHLIFSTFLILGCSAVFWFTAPRFYADTANYALHIVQHWERHSPAPGLDPLWDFGHLLWRPFGYVLWLLSGGAASQDPVLHAANVLIAISGVCTVLSIILLYFLAAHYSGKPWVGLVTALGLLATHAVINHSRTGTAYIPGMTCQLAALYWLERQIRERRERSIGTWLGSGVLLGLSVLFWFPYSLTVPGVLAFAVLYRSTIIRARMALLLRMAAVCAMVVAATYALALAADHITTLAMAHDWFVRSRYGISPNRGYFRVMTGVPRSFFWLGEDGVFWKRLLFQPRIVVQHPALVSQILARAWKLLAVYAFLLVVGLELARAKSGHRLLVVLLIATVPVLYFAIFLFDASPPDRYLPVFPMLFLCVAHMLARVGRRRTSIVLVCLFGLMFIANAVALSRAGYSTRWSTTSAKVTCFARNCSRQDLLILLSFQDDVFRMWDEAPFDPLMRRVAEMYIAGIVGTQHALNWQSEVSDRILDKWEHGHNVWISKRLLASRPQPEWNWVEGDDPRLHWADFPAYFAPLQAVKECCGDDGYVLLAKTPENVAYLHQRASELAVALH